MSLVTLSDVHDHLNLGTDTTHDTEIQGFIDAMTSVIEDIVGPVASRTVTEWHHGGGPQIVVRQPPILSVTSLTEYRGSTPYVLTGVASPDLASSNSFMFEPCGIITRLTAASAAPATYLSSQGLFSTFPAGPSSVQVVYVAGTASTAPNVRLATLMLIGFHYQGTQLGGRPGVGSAAASADLTAGSIVQGFFVPNKVRELLLPGRRPPAVA